MAETIVIEYKGDVSDLIAQLNQLENANKKVTQSADKAGETITDEFDEAAEAVGDTNEEVDELNDSLKQTTKEGKKAGQTTEKSFKKTNGVANQFNKTIGRIGIAMASAFAVDRLISFGKEATKLGRELSGVSQAFDRIGSPQLLDELRNSTRGLVSDLELMKAAVQASNFKIPLTELGSLFEFAQRRAQETGESVEFLTQSIVTGIARKSPLILDNLGISAIELREKLNGVSVEAASIGDVTQAVGEIASAELLKMGDAAVVAGDRIAQAGVKWENFKASVGEDILVFLDDAIEGYEEWSGAIKSQGGLLGAWENQMDLAALRVRSLNKDNNTGIGIFLRVQQAIHAQRVEMGLATNITDDFADAFEGALDKLRSFGQAAIELPSVTDKFAEGVTRLAAAAKGIPFEEYVAQLKAADAAQKAAAERAARAARSLDELKKAADEANAAVKAASPTAENYASLINKARIATDEFEKAQKRLNDALGERKDVDQALIDQLNANIKAEEGAAEMIADIRDKQLKEASEAQDELEKGFDELLDKEVESERKRAKAVKEAEEEKTKARQRAFDVAIELNNAIFSIANSNLERQIQAIQAQDQARLAAIDNDLNNTRLSEARKNELIEERARIEQESADQIAEIKRKQAVNDKAQALFNIGLSTAQGIVAALASVPPNVPLSIAIGAIGAAQLAAAAAQPIPAFAKGVIDMGGKGTATSDSNLAWLSKGESVTPAAATKKHRGALEAIHGDFFDKYVNTNYIVPAIKAIDKQLSEKRSGDLAANLANSLNLQSAFSDGNIVAQLRRQRYDGERNTEKIVDAINKSGRKQIKTPFFK